MINIIFYQSKYFNHLQKNYLVSWIEKCQIKKIIICSRFSIKIMIKSKINMNNQLRIVPL